MNRANCATSNQQTLQCILRADNRRTHLRVRGICVVWTLALVCGLNACGDDGMSAESDAAASMDAHVDSLDSPADASLDALLDVAESDVALDAGMIDARSDADPPPRVAVNDDGTFRVRADDGSEQELCGCEDDPLRLAFAPRFDVVVGRPASLFFDNLIEGNGSDYDWEVWVSGGLALEEESHPDHWQVGAAEAGEADLFVVARAASGEAQGVARARLVVSAVEAGSGTRPSVLFVGDSTTANGVYVRTLANIFETDPMGVEPVGTLVSAGHRHEGRSGWQISDYATDSRGAGANPFFGGEGFDFAHYLDTSGVSAPDYFIVHLGINDLFGQRERAQEESKVQRMLSQLNAFIDSIRDASPSTHVALALTIVPCGTDSGFRASYSDIEWATRDAYKARIVRWARTLIDAFGDRTDVSLIPVNARIDAMLGFPHTGSGDTIAHTNGVHPNADGYAQMAETFYAWLKGRPTL